MKIASIISSPILAYIFVAVTTLPGSDLAWGESQPAIEPQEFAPGIISTGNEFGITFMPDGREACFSRTASHQPTHIFCSRMVEGKWQEPEKISLSDDNWSDLDPFISPDGKQLFFVSTRPSTDEAKATGKGNMDIWVADRNDANWMSPHPVENVNSESKEGSPSVARDGTLYFFSDRKDGSGNNAIYESRLVNKRYAEPVLLSSAINAGPSDTSPFISPDGKTLLFYSTRGQGFGKADLYVSYKHAGNWEAASNLGPVVNSSESEYNPSVSPDGKQFFFGRNRKLYVVSVGAIAVLNPERFNDK